MADRIGQQVGNYRILRLLGRGGQASVYLGEHLYLQSHAALKVLHTSLQDTDVQRFLSEAQTLVRLRYPHIVRVLDFAVEQGTPVLIMDYAPGGTVRERCPGGSCLPLNTVVAYVRQVAAALQYAHNRSVIHRDIKPENLLLGEHQQVLLSDFGLALFAPSPELLSTQEMAGSIPYMAPEQIRGKPGFASDQYALGVVTYEWLCGAHPFKGPPWEIVQHHLSAAPPPLREKNPALPPAVEEVVLRALAKDPEHRFVSVQAFAHALARASRMSTFDDDSQVTAPLHESSTSPFMTLPDPTAQMIFLSASPADEALAARLKADLQAQGILAEFPGHLAGPQEEVRRAIRAAHLVLVVLSPHARSSRTVKEHLRIASLYERALVFVWVAGDQIAAVLPEAWGKTAVIDLIDARQSRYESALEEIVDCLKGEMSVTAPLEPYLAASLAEPRNPYKGLRAFSQDDAADFFGRDRLVQELVEGVRDSLAIDVPVGQKARLLAVVGPSGSGKSSVVMAGLLPQLRNGALPGSKAWVYLEPTLPGTHPLESLALTLA